MLFIVSFNKLVSVHLKATSGESFFIVNKPNDPIDTISIVRVYQAKAKRTPKQCSPVTNTRHTPYNKYTIYSCLSFIC